MKTVQFLDTVSQDNAIADQPTLHSLVSVIDFSNSTPKQKSTPISALQFGFYIVFLKNDQSCRIRYGRGKYDYQEGTLIFIAPGQVVSIEENPEYYQPSGHALLFHPDLIRGTAIGQHIKDYTFFPMTPTKPYISRI